MKEIITTNDLKIESAKQICFNKSNFQFRENGKWIAMNSIDDSKEYIIHIDDGTVKPLIDTKEIEIVLKQNVEIVWTIELNLKFQKKKIVQTINKIKQDFSNRRITYLELKEFRKEIDSQIKAYRQMAADSDIEWDLL